MKRNLFHALMFIVTFTGMWWHLKDDAKRKTVGMRNPARAARVWAPSDSTLVDSLVAYGVARVFADSVFNDPRLAVDSAVVKVLTGTRGKPDYSFLFTDGSVADGAAFLKTHRTELDSLQARYGVSPKVIAAMLRLETNFGKYLGRHRVVNALYTMYHASPRRRTMALRELTCFLRTMREQESDPFATLGSWAGAYGIAQFMPCSYLAYAVDGNGDGIADLFTLDDAMPSIANYLRAHGWSERELHQLRALHAYNRGSYASAVMAYASRLSSN